MPTKSQLWQKRYTSNVLLPVYKQNKGNGFFSSVYNGYLSVTVRPSSPSITVDRTPLVEDILGKLKCEIGRALPDTVIINWITKILTNITAYDDQTHVDNQDGTVQEISYLQAPFTRFSNGEWVKCKAQFTNHDGSRDSEETRHILNVTCEYNNIRFLSYIVWTWLSTYSLKQCLSKLIQDLAYKPVCNLGLGEFFTWIELLGPLT